MLSKLSRYIVHILGSILAMFAFSPVLALPQQKMTDEPVGLISVNIGYPQANYWPLYVARDLKLFEQVGLAPSFTTFTTGAPLIAGMQNGSVDVAWTGLATVFMLGKSIPLKFVLVPIDTSSQMSMVVNPRSGIRSYKDLKKSKAIGAPSGTCGEVSAVLAAKRARVPISTLNVSNLAPNLLLGALQNHQIDTAFIWGPWDLQLRQAGFKIVSSDKDFVPGGGSCGVTIAIRPKFLEQHPSVGCKLVKVQALALAAARKEPEMVIRIIQKELRISHNLAKESFRTLAIPSIKSQLDPDSTWSLTNENGGLSKKLMIASEALYEAKSFAQPLTKETIWHSIDASYVKQYLETDCK